MTPVFNFRALSRALAIAVAVLAVNASAAQAQAFISPYIGYNFGGDAACPAGLTGCEEKNTVLGVSFGNLNALLGFEEDLSYSKGLLKAPGLAASSVLTVMSNVVIGPQISYARPYVAGGFGLIRTTAKFSPASLVQLNDSDIGWNMGGGIMVVYGHIGVRGDLRFFHGFSDFDVLGVPVSDSKLDYGRATVAFVLQ